MSLTPQQLCLLQNSLTDLLKKENGVEDDKQKFNKNIIDAQNRELQNKIKGLKASGQPLQISPEKFFGALGRKS